jgi:hypothetical protein
MVISIKYHLKDGEDLNCLNTLKLIYPTIGPFRRELNKHEIELLRLMQVSRHFIF